MTLRVALDYRPALLTRSGIGRYVRELVSCDAWGDAAHLELFAAMRRPARIEAAPKRTGVRLATGRTPGRVQQLLGLAVERWTGPVDVVHATDFVPLKQRGGGRVVTVHDLGFLRDPACHLPRNVGRLTRVTEAAVRRADVVVTPTRATADDVAEFFDVDEGRLVVAHHGVAAEWADLTTVMRRDGPPVILAVGTIEPRKNHARLLRAFSALVTDTEAELRLVGRRGWLCDEVFELLERSDLRGRARWLGELNEAALRREMAQASVCAYPSTLEGFGMPVLEALASGIPVLTSDVPALREVAGDAALLVDPHDVDALTDGLRRLLDDTDLRAELARRGQERAARFTWESSVAAHLDAYRRAAEA